MYDCFGMLTVGAWSGVVIALVAPLINGVGPVLAKSLTEREFKGQGSVIQANGTVTYVSSGAFCEFVYRYSSTVGYVVSVWMDPGRGIYATCLSLLILKSHVSYMISDLRLHVL